MNIRFLLYVSLLVGALAVVHGDSDDFADNSIQASSFHEKDESMQTIIDIVASSESNAQNVCLNEEGCSSEEGDSYNRIQDINEEEAQADSLEYDELYQNAVNHHRLSGRWTHLSRSSWPSDHGDSSRSKYSLGHGLPKDFDPKNLRVLYQPNITSPQWLYTYGERSENIILLGGPSVTNTSVYKLDSRSLEILQTFHLPSSMYLGGLLMHGNGHVYAIHANKLFAFWDADLTNFTVVTLPSRLNEGIIQTNGMIVTQDGLIVVKQWSTMLDDVLFYSAALLPIIPMIISIFLASLLISSKFFNQLSKSKTSILLIVKVSFGLLIGSIISLTVIKFMMMSATKQSFDMKRFILDSRLFSADSGGGEIKFIDPLSLSVVAEAVLPERCSIARMSLVAVNNSITGESEDALILLGDELVYQFRWRPSTKSLHLLPAWTRRYRKFGDGSYQGTGAAIYDEVAYYTDNTFPVFLYGRSYRMYRAPLSVNDERSLINATDITVTPQRDYDQQRQFALKYIDEAMRAAPIDPGYHLTDSIPGFMFWSVVVSPIIGDIITWDTAARLVQARRLDNMTIHWNATSWHADCLTVAADKGHVYVSDYSSAPPSTLEWLPALSSIYDLYGSHSGVDKYLIILNASDGSTLANITIGTKSGIRLSMIIPGGNDDVIVGTRKGLVRVYHQQP